MGDSSLVRLPPVRLCDLPRLYLHSDDVHLWRFNADAGSIDLADCLAVLEPSERARADRFVHHSDRARFIAAHGVLRHVLAAYVDISAEALRFSAGPQGKPCLTGSGPSFNLSHADGFTLIGVARAEYHLGVDVERHHPISEMAALVQSTFSPAEIIAWGALPSSEREAGFFRLWTRKEAFVKATGEGLSRPLTSFTVTVGESAALCEPRLAQWSIHSLDTEPQFVAALAIDHPAPSLFYKHIAAAT